MKCINDDLIQKYIDSEATSDEINYIENHISLCSKCAKIIDKQRKLSIDIKKNINLSYSNKSLISIPEFTYNPIINTRRKNINIKKYIYAASVACIFFLIFLLIPKKEQEKNIVFLYNIAGEFDANKTISQQEMVLTIIDSDGNILQLN